MTCSNCGKVLASDDKFCSQCGTAVVAPAAPIRTDAGTPKPSALKQPKQPKKLKVLVIDDDPMFLETYLFQFEKEGFSVVLARNGLEGLKFAHSEKPSVILLDVLMPGMNGLDVLRTLKKDPETRDIPVVMATIVDEKGFKEQGLALGADYYITKESMTSYAVLEKVRAAATRVRNGRH